MDDRTNQGYKIIDSVRITDRHEVVLGESPTAPDRYVIWNATKRPDGTYDYDTGKYFSPDSYVKAQSYFEDRAREKFLANVRIPSRTIPVDDYSRYRFKVLVSKRIGTRESLLCSTIHNHLLANYSVRDIQIDMDGTPHNINEYFTESFVEALKLYWERSDYLTPAYVMECEERAKTGAGLSSIKRLNDYFIGSIEGRDPRSLIGYVLILDDEALNRHQRTDDHQLYFVCDTGISKHGLPIFMCENLYSGQSRPIYPSMVRGFVKDSAMPKWAKSREWELRISLTKPVPAKPPNDKKRPQRQDQESR